MRYNLLLLCVSATLCSAGIQFPFNSRFSTADHQPPLDKNSNNQRRTGGFSFPSFRDRQTATSSNNQHSNVFTRRDTEQITTEARSVVFPGPWLVETTTEDVQLPKTTVRSSKLTSKEAQNCSIHNFTIFYPPTGKCENLLERGPCGEDQWLVARPPLNRPVCSYRPCVRGFANSRRSNCTSEVRCHFDKSPYATPQGEILCMCNAGTALWKEDGRCYRLFKKGPCPANSQLILDAFDETVCVTNPCNNENMALFEVPATEGMLVNNQNYLRCYEFGRRGPCQEDYIFELDLRSLKPSCISAEFALDMRHLLRSASFKCPPGTYRSYSGACKKGFVVKDFRTAFNG